MESYITRTVSLHVYVCMPVCLSTHIKDERRHDFNYVLYDIDNFHISPSLFAERENVEIIYKIEV